MKKILILLIIVGSCKTYKQPYYTTKNFERDEFILDYKKSILYGCIDEATNNNFYEFIKENNDLGISIVVETSKIDVIKIIEEGRKLSKNIRTINYSDYNGKKPIFNDCVSFAFSKQSDSIARIKYKQYKLYKKKDKRYY